MTKDKSNSRCDLFGRLKWYHDVWLESYGYIFAHMYLVFESVRWDGSAVYRQRRMMHYGQRGRSSSCFPKWRQVCGYLRSVAIVLLHVKLCIR